MKNYGNHSLLHRVFTINLAIFFLDTTDLPSTMIGFREQSQVTGVKGMDDQGEGLTIHGLLSVAKIESTTMESLVGDQREGAKLISGFSDGIEGRQQR